MKVSLQHLQSGINGRKKIPSVDPKWEKCEPEYKSEMITPSKNFYEKLESLQGKSTAEIFEQLLSDVLELMLQQTLTYALQKNDPQFTLELNKIKTFMGILLFSGYHKLPQQNMYWEQSPDTGIPLLYNAMTRQKFKTINRYLHLNENAMIDASDKMYELRPFLDALNTNFQKFGIFHSHLSIRRRRLKGIHSRSDTNRTGAEGLSFYYPRLLYWLDQMLAMMSLM